MKILKIFFTAIFIIILFPSLLGLTLALIINTTILDSEFMITALSNMDISFILDDILENQIKAEIPEEIRIEFSGQIKKILENQLDKIVTPLYNFLLGESETLESVVSLTSIKKDLKPVLLQYMLQSQPKEYHAYIKKEFNTYWNKISSEIPEKIDLRKLTEDNSVYERILFVKQIISIFKQAMIVLIIAVIILTLLIILIQRKLKSLLLIFGVLFLLIGILLFPINMIIDYFTGSDLFTKEIPLFLYSMVTSLITVIMSKIRMFGIIYLIAGSICIGGFFLVKRKKSQGNEQENSQN